MAAKVGLVLALDGEKQFSAGLKAANEAVKEAKSSLSAVKSQYEGNANSMAALEARAKALANVHNSLALAQQKAQAGLDNSNRRYQEIAASITQYEQKIKRLEEAQARSASVYGTGSKNYQMLSDAIEKNKTLLAEERVEQDKQLASYAKWQTALNNVNKDMRSNNREIAEVDRYLDEASHSADGCATSIDAFGRRVGDTGNQLRRTENDVESFGNILEQKLFRQFGKEQIFNMMVNGLRRIGQAAKDAAKAVVQTGMDFEAQMSRVGAISNASESSMDLLSQKAQQLGRSTVYTATESASAMEQMALAGWKTTDIVKGIDGVLSLASASGMDLAQAAEYVTDNINAFGREASYATQLSDIMAAAMSNSSMTTEDLGEAYSKVAATAASFRYSETEVTAVLMNMANAGKKGSEAGVALNTIMTRMATNTSKCAEEIAKYNDGIDIVYDKSTGKMRPLTNILEDLGRVWGKLDDSQKAALSKTLAGTRQITALNTIMAGLGESTTSTNKSFSEYKDLLEQSAGAAKRMADVSLDNLTGDVELMNDALSGLAIKIYDSGIGDALRSDVQLITSMINGLADTIEAPMKESPLVGFIDDLWSKLDEAQEHIDNAENAINGAKFDVSSLEAYKELIIEINEKIQNGTATEFEKFELAQAVDALKDSVPELAAAFDSETGALKATNAELEAMFNNSEKVAMANALIEARTESMKAQLDLDIRKKMATEALTMAQEEYNAALEANKFGGMEQQVADATDQLDITKSAMEEVTKQEKELTDATAAQEAVFDEWSDKLGTSAKNVDEFVKSEEEATEATAGLGDEVERVYDEFGNDITLLDESVANEITQETEEIKKAYEELESSVKSSIEGCISMMDEWSQSDSIGADQILANLDTQIEGISNWKDNMETLAGEVGTSLSQELYDQLVQMGPESAGLIQDLVDAMAQEGENGESKLKEISDKWSEAMELSEDTSAITEATSQGQAVAEAYAEGLDLGIESWSGGSLSKAVEKASKEAEAAAKSSGESIGEAEMQGTSEGVTSNGGTVSDAVNSVISEAESSAASTAQSSFFEVGAQIDAGVAAGINANSGIMIDAISAVMDAVVAAAKGRIQIASPSKVFKREVGKWIPAGVAEGIKENSALAGKAAAEMSETTLAAARKWLGEYKKRKDVSLRDEEYYWEQVSLQVKNGSAAYKEAVKNLDAVRKNLLSATLSESGFSDKQVKEIQKKISKAFSVDRKDDKGKKKDAEKYYSEIYKAAQTYAKNQQILNDWSLEQELAYWTKVKKTLKKGTQAYYDALKQTKDLKQKIKDEVPNDEDYFGDILSQSRTYFDNQQVLREWDLQEQLKYWENVKGTIKKGTQAWYDVLKEIKSVKQSIKDATPSDEDYYGDILSQSKKYIDNQQILNEWSLEEQLKYWQNVRKTIKKGTQAWYDATKIVKDLQKEIKDSIPDDETKYSGLLSDAQKYFDNQQILREWDLQEQLDYWLGIKASMKKGTQAWYDALKTVKDLQKKIQDEKPTDESILSDAKTYFDNQQILREWDLEEQLKYFENVRKSLKKGSQAWYDATKTIKDIQKEIKDSQPTDDDILSDAKKYFDNQQILREWDLQAQLEYFENVRKNLKKGSQAWYDATKIIKDLQKEIKDSKPSDEDYYSDVLSQAQKYEKNQRILREWSLQDQLSYWQSVKAGIKKGTQAWYDATETVNNLKKQIADETKNAEKDLLSRTSGNQNKILSNYKTYRKLSLRAEMQYWDAARMQLQQGTEERISADQNYYSAKQAYYEALKDLDEKYRDDYDKVVKDMEDKTDELVKKYNDAVSSRKDSILSSMDLFSSFESEGTTGEKLIENIQSQVEALSMWEQSLRDLKARGVSDSLYKVLQDAGINQAANVYSILQMSDEQLRHYEELFAAREQLAEMQATEENSGLLKEVNDEIQKVQSEADKALADLNQTYSENLAEISETISNELIGMLNKAPVAAEEAIAQMFKKFSSNAVAEYSLQGTTDKIESELAGIVVKAESVGTDAVKGLMKGLSDQNLITEGAQKTIDQIKKALQEAAEIHSPSRLFNRDVGVFLGEGVAEGMDASATRTAKSATDMIRKSLLAAREEFERQSIQLQEDVDGVNLGSNTMLNEIARSYNPQTIVNVDNSQVSSQIAQFSTLASDMMKVMKNMKVVLDSGETVGALTSKIDTGLAAESRRRFRGPK